MKKLSKIIQEELGAFINEASIDKDGNLIGMEDDQLVDFKSFPPSVLKTLDGEYFGYDNNFDWNTTQDYYHKNNDQDGFTEFLKRNKSEQFKKNIGKLITYTIQDMILKRKQYIAKRKLHDFEELIIPAFGNEILCGKLSEYEYNVLMNSNATIEDLERGFKEAKEIVDQYGNIDYSKINKTDRLKIDDQVNWFNFERYVEKHPEYRKAFEEWERLINEDSEIGFKSTHAYRETTPYDRIKELRDFLINYRNTKM